MTDCQNTSKQEKEPVPQKVHNHARLNQGEGCRNNI